MELIQCIMYIFLQLDTSAVFDTASSAVPDPTPSVVLDPASSNVHDPAYSVVLASSVCSTFTTQHLQWYSPQVSSQRSRPSVFSNTQRRQWYSKKRLQPILRSVFSICDLESSVLFLLRVFSVSNLASSVVLDVASSAVLNMASSLVLDLASSVVLDRASSVVLDLASSVVIKLASSVVLDPALHWYSNQRLQWESIGRLQWYSTQLFSGTRPSVFSGTRSRAVVLHVHHLKLNSCRTSAYNFCLKQMGVNTDRTSFLLGNCSGHHNTEPRHTYMNNTNPTPVFCGDAW